MLKCVCLDVYLRKYGKISLNFLGNVTRYYQHHHVVFMTKIPETVMELQLYRKLKVMNFIHQPVINKNVNNSK